MPFSPAEWWKYLPKEYGENVEFRLWFNKKCAGSRLLRKAVWRACASDIRFWVNTWVVQFNPLKVGCEPGPFLTYPIQDEALDKILWSVENKRDLFLEKSRYQGASWLCLLAMEWLWHFHSWKKFLCVSKSEKAVEDDDPDSLFWKLDFVHRYVPDWLMPGGGKAVKRRKLYFGNDANGSTITGAASTGDAGVGGRATAMFVDEFSLIRQDVELYSHSALTALCRIFNGTHRGMGTEFFRLSQSKDIQKLVMHWSDHPEQNKGLYRSTGRGQGYEIIDGEYEFDPEYQFNCSGEPAGGPFPGLRSPWYDAQVKRLGSKQAVAMDLDINPSGSTHQFFDALTIHELKADCCEPTWRGELEYDEDGRPGRLIEVPDGKLSVWLTPDPYGRFKRDRYAFGADSAFGHGGTPSCLSGVSGRTGVKVLEYKDAWIDPKEFARLSVAICRLFLDDEDMPGLFAWESGGPGSSVTKEVLELGFRRIYYRVDPLKDRLRGSVRTKLKPDSPGWSPTPNAMKMLLMDYKTALERRQFVNRSESALNECLMFEFGSRGQVEHGLVAAKDDPSGARDNHGDMVIADALAWMMAKWIPQEELEAAKEEVSPMSLAARMKAVEEKARHVEEGWVS